MELYCQTCKVNVCNKSHWKCDWHNHNITRKSQALDPISSNEFEDLVNIPVIVEASQSSFYCFECKKSFKSESQLKTHCSSKKHLEVVKSTRSNSYCDNSSSAVISNSKDWKSLFANANTDEDYERLWKEKLEASIPLSITDCLFCSKSSSSMEMNLEHMSLKHSFFIPYAEFLVNTQGLLEHLGESIAILNQCIYCGDNSKFMYSTEACQAHMISKSHCKLAMDDGLSDSLRPYYQIPEEDSDGNTDVDDWNEQNQNDIGWTLPSGKQIGHRSFKRYYKQSLKVKEIVPGSNDDPYFKRIGFSRAHGTSNALTLKQEQAVILETRKQVIQQLRHEQYIRDGVQFKHHKLVKHFHAR
ncbi:C2H2 type zinc-finger-domain-containing protein [Globomyces pollinis-pini]|nr:C2H2 type zinc-finger-domain-containing protein [Globomyces pollinis-pini]